MTIETLQDIRHFLTRVVAHGDEQTRLLESVDRLDAFIHAMQKVRQAA
jgi:hypothetical protein